MEVLFESSRQFKLWRYSVSHKVLLLRSSRDEDNSTRIDVLFQQVARMQLDTVFESLTIGRASGGERSEIESQAGREFPGGTELFIVGGELANYVLSGSIVWHEDEGTYRDPSFFEKILLL
ncbi:hypothetical protein [Micromonospora sp. LOL_023]|uniref:hypothetical protein n=1 Tax=Micromonospora sp. LOL_023 TaxID=3345418 RepID=UPI003A8A24DD